MWVADMRQAHQGCCPVAVGVVNVRSGCQQCGCDFTVGFGHGDHEWSKTGDSLESRLMGSVGQLVDVDSKPIEYKNCL